VLQRIFATLSLKMVSLVLTLISLPILLAKLQPAGYGQYLIFLSIGNLIATVHTLGIGFQAWRTLPSLTSVAERGEIFYPQLLSTLPLLLTISSALYFVGSTSILSAYGLSGPPELWRLISYFVVVIGIHNQVANLFRYTGDIKYFNAVVTLPPIGLSCVIIFLPGEVISSPADIFIVNILLYLLTLILSAPRLLSYVGFYLSFQSLSDMKVDLRLGGGLLVVALIEQLFAFVDRVSISAFLDIDSVGYFGAAFSITSLILFVPRMITTVVEPAIFRAHDRNRTEDIGLLLSSLVYLWCWVAIPVVTFVYFFGHIALELYLGSEMATVAAEFLYLMMATSVLQGIVVLLSCVLISARRTDLILGRQLLGIFVHIVLTLGLLMFFGELYWVAVSGFVANATMLVFTWVSVNRTAKVLVNPSVLFAMFGSAVCSCLWLIVVDIFSPETSLANIVMGLSLMCVTYIGAMLLIPSYRHKIFNSLRELRSFQ